MKAFWKIVATSMVAAGACLGAVHIARSATPAIPATDNTEIRSFAKDNWTQANGDLDNSRYSELSQINTDTVKNLGAVWISDKFDNGGNGRVTPIVHDGMMFVTAGTKVYALDAKTGKWIWKYEVTTSAKPANGRGVPTGAPNREGVAVYQGKVYIATTDSHILALDEMTGKPVWNKLVNDDLTPVLHGGISAVPTIVNGVIYTCITFGEARYIGRMLALDANDGHLIWRWDSVPGPGEPGHETWAQGNDAWKMGGGDAWMPPAVDVALGLVYYGTGNPSPNRQAAAARPGNNLYTSSVVALDMKTGKLRWYYQLTHHDLWEGDLGTPLVSYDTEINGHKQKVLAALRDDGTLFLLDRATGKPVWPVEERKVRQSELLKTSPTQPYPVGRKSLIERDCSAYKPIPGFEIRCDSGLFQPPTNDPPNVLSYYCGVRNSPMSYDPQTGYIYMQGPDQLTWQWVSNNPPTWDLGITEFLTSRVPEIAKQDMIIYEAVDPKTYKVVWRKESPRPISIYGSGGFISTAGGLVFHRLEDGNLAAYNAKTGDELWKFQTGVADSAVIPTATPMTYEVDGEQYVSIIMLDHVWAFKLGGQLPPHAAPKMPAHDDILRGPVEDAQVIRASVPNDFDYRHQISPTKARVKTDSEVTFQNNGSEVHEFAAVDGSWTTGSLWPRQIAILKFDKPGTYLYHCTKHPWSYGMLIVTDASQTADAKPSEGGTGFTAQAAQGKSVYAQYCSLCHQTELQGNDFIPALAGSAFMGRWDGKPASDLLEKTRSTMPTNAPGSLDAKLYADVVAYLLQVNGMTPRMEIAADTASKITIH